jgi:hypothetical protein
MDTAFLMPSRQFIVFSILRVIRNFIFDTFV